MTETRALLDLIDQLKRQHRAGEHERFGQIDQLFDLAASARQELAAIEAGLLPAMPRAAARAAVLQRIELAPIRMTLDVGATARALLEALPAAAHGR